MIWLLEEGDFSKDLANIDQFLRSNLVHCSKKIHQKSVSA